MRCCLVKVAAAVGAVGSEELFALEHDFECLDGEFDLDGFHVVVEGECDGA